MPRGVPKAGFRKPRNGGRFNPNVTFNVPGAPLVHITQESDLEIEQKLQDRFEILTELTHAAIIGDARSLIVSGPAGLGKSYTVEQAVSKWDPDGKRHEIIKGFVRATGLYKKLFAYRHPGNVLVFDDADSIFFDDTSLNFLKAVCDTNDSRRVSYLSEGDLFDDETGAKIPKSFEFAGTIVFITNYDFDAMIDKGHKLAPHLQAMLSRSHYIDLAMKTRRDYIIRIKQVVKQGLLEGRGLTKSEQDEVVKFVVDNADRMRELSLRAILKLAVIRKTGGARWERMATVTVLKNN